jgi:hypothetical protein
MTLQGAAVYVISIGIAVAVAVPLRRALRRGSPRFNTLATVIVVGVLAVAVAIVFLS